MNVILSLLFGLVEQKSSIARSMYEFTSSISHGAETLNDFEAARSMASKLKGEIEFYVGRISESKSRLDEIGAKVNVLEQEIRRLEIQQNECSDLELGTNIGNVVTFTSRTVENQFREARQGGNTETSFIFGDQAIVDAVSSVSSSVESISNGEDQEIHITAPLNVFIELSDGTDGVFLDIGAQEIISTMIFGSLVVIQLLSGHTIILSSVEKIYTDDAFFDVTSGIAGAWIARANSETEKLLGTHSEDNLYGNENDNVIVGNGGRDRLYGGDGNDVFFVAVGDLAFGEIYNGGADDDTLQLTGSGPFSFAGVTLTDVEHVEFTDAGGFAFFTGGFAGLSTLSDLFADGVVDVSWIEGGATNIATAITSGLNAGGVQVVSTDTAGAAWTESTLVFDASGVLVTKLTGNDDGTLVEWSYAGSVRNFVCGRAVSIYAPMARMKRSPNRTANCAFAIDHSRGGIFHSFSCRFKIR